MGMIVEGETGVSFRPGTPVDLADVLEPLLVDPERREPHRARRRRLGPRAPQLASATRSGTWSCTGGWGGLSG